MANMQSPVIPPAHTQAGLSKPMVLAGLNGLVHAVSEEFTQLSKHTTETFYKNGGLESLFENVSTYSEIVEWVNNGKKWEGHVIFLDATHDEYVGRVTATPYPNGNNETYIALGFYEVARSKTNEQIETRLLKAITECTDILFNEPEPYKALPAVLNIIGKAIQADRCYIYILEEVNEKGEQFAERKFEWLKKPTLNSKFFKNRKRFNYNTIKSIQQRLQEGLDVYITQRTKSPADIVDVLQQRGIFSLLKIPIFKNEKLWGFLGFEDVQNIRDWSRAEKKALRSLAHNIGAFIKINSLTDELLTKNKQLESAIEGATDGLWVQDFENNSLYISPRMYSIFGYAQQDWPTHIDGIRDLLKTEDTELLAEKLAKAIQNMETVLDFETVAKHQKGRYIWIKGTVTFSYNKAGKVEKHSGSLTDISTEKTYELKIRRQAEHYQRLVNSLKEVVFETDSQGKLTFLNNSWKNVTGKNIRDSLGKKLGSFICLGFKDLFEEALQLLATKQTWPGKLELQLTGKDGQPYWVEIWLRGLYDANYELTGISGSIFDIHTKKMATRQLLESEERYRLISENTKDLVCLQNLEGQYQYISPSVHDMLGFTVQSLVGKHFADYVHPEDQKAVKLYFNKIAKDKQVGFIRYRVIHSKGHYLWVETISNLQQNPQGLYLIQTSTRDISEQKLAEEEVKNALEKERQLVELRTNLINMISHEFRTPLTTIKSSSDLLLKYLPTLKKSDVKDRFSLHFGRIGSQVNRINELISGVLVLGRMDSGKIQFQPEMVDFVEFIDAFLDEYYQTHPEENRRIELTFEGQTRPIKVDTLLVSHILRNLVSNSLKYSIGKQNPELCIKFEKKLVNITIKDYGIGIGEKDLQNLFQSFYRGSNAFTISGTGLGLVIVKQFIDMHGGTIDVQSAINEGTKIHVTLPI